eukprot:1159394-Pelagomonas_calceolata.AAC.7
MSKLARASPRYMNGTGNPVYCPCKQGCSQEQWSYGPGISASGGGGWPGPKTPVPGLYVCGDSTMPGIGVPAAAASLLRLSGRVREWVGDRKFSHARRSDKDSFAKCKHLAWVL